MAESDRTFDELALSVRPAVSESLRHPADGLGIRSWETEVGGDPAHRSTKLVAGFDPRCEPFLRRFAQLFRNDAFARRPRMRDRPRASNTTMPRTRHARSW